MTAGAAERALATDLAQCAAVAAADTRLACFDALAARALPGPAPQARPAAPVAPAHGAVAATAPVPAVGAAGPAAAGAPSAPPAAPAASEDPQHFGLSTAQLEAAGQKSAGIQSIEARITGLAADQLRSGYVVLDNGQTWKCTDGDMALNVGDAVTIKRAALGSFILISEANHSYHVRRLR
jgi:hypothetical protein